MYREMTPGNCQLSCIGQEAEMLRREQLKCRVELLVVI